MAHNARSHRFKASEHTRLFNASEHSYLTPWLAGLQASCITHDRMIGVFTPPLSNEKLLCWWKEKFAEAAAGSRIIILLLNDAEPGAKVQGEDLVGVVMLAMPHIDTAPYRADVESLLVSSKHRKQGGGRALLQAVHEQAIKRGKTLLMVQAEAESHGERIFKAHHYLEAGRVPKYWISPLGEKKDAVFLYTDIST